MPVIKQCNYCGIDCMSDYCGNACRQKAIAKAARQSCCDGYRERIAALEACLREYMADCLECVHAELPVWCGKCVKAATLLGPGASAPKNNPINL